MIESLMDKVLNYRNHIESKGDNNRKADLLWRIIFDEFDKINITDEELDKIENIVGNMKIKKDEVLKQLQDYLKNNKKH